MHGPSKRGAEVGITVARNHKHKKHGSILRNREAFCQWIRVKADSGLIRGEGLLIPALPFEKNRVE